MKPEKVTYWAGIAQIIQLILQVATIVMPIIAIGAISQLPEDTKIETHGIVINKFFQCLMIVCCFLLYLQYRRNIYNSDPVREEYNFLQYIIIYSFTHKQASLIPIIITLSLLCYIYPFFVFLFVFGSIFLIPSLVEIEEDSFNTYLDKWNYNDEFRNKWVVRIFETLGETNVISTKSFFDRGYSVGDYHQINTVLFQFYKDYEFDYHMKIRKENVENEDLELVTLEYLGKKDKTNDS